MTVYVIVNSETLKIYVGQHKRDTDLARYMLKKISDANRRNLGLRSHLYNAMKLYPRDVWSIHPLVSGIEDKAVLDETERFFIRALKAQHPDVGYNICRGGEGHTAPLGADSLARLAAKNKISMRGNTNGRGNHGKHYPKSPEFRARVSAKMKGVAKSSEHAQHIGDGKRGHRYNLGNQFSLGKKHTAEWLEDARRRMTGFQHTEEAKAKMRHPKSPETIAKMRIAQQTRRTAERQT